MVVKRQRIIMVGKDHELYDMCENITSKALNLKNAVRFRQRQVSTARSKSPEELTDNEKSVIDEFSRYAGVDILEKKNRHLSYNLLYHVLQDSRNPDYYADKFPVQSAQQMIKQCVADWDNWISALHSWYENSSKFTGKPKMPDYGRKGGHATVTVTNQDCKLKQDDKGQSWAYFPFYKKTPLCIGMTEGVLKEVKIKPMNNIYGIYFTFDVNIPDAVPSGKHERIVGIDFGVDNLMAVTNNIGKPCILYKGGIIKSANRFYNKKLSGIMTEEMNKPNSPKNKDGNPKFVPTEESMYITQKRNNQIHDFMHQTVSHFIAWCVENRTDTIVCGVNRYWKQESGIGHVNNQNFVQIPFAFIRNIIKYKAEEYGIDFIEQEESYTSKASFIDNDDIPVYKKGNICRCTFSGRRRPTHYKGMYKKDGFRGLYVSKDGTIINSDLNGSANIIRKAMPDAFTKGKMPDFMNVIIIKNPSDEFIYANRRNQTQETRPLISRSKARRLKKKLVA